jgi:SPP1 family predicted phage head-tail adaptor
MRAGPLRHRITLQSKEATQDEIGQPVGAWTEVANVAADIRHLTGLEAVKAGGEVAVARASIRIRYRPGVVPAMRATVGDIVYDIKAVLPDPTGRRHLDLLAETGQSEG